jgi:hypothetical protein
LASNAQAMRAILLASATTTTLNGLRARSCVSQGYSAARNNIPELGRSPWLFELLDVLDAFGDNLDAHAGADRQDRCHDCRIAQIANERFVDLDAVDRELFEMGRRRPIG